MKLRLIVLFILILSAAQLSRLGRFPSTPGWNQAALAASYPGSPLPVGVPITYTLYLPVLSQEWPPVPASPTLLPIEFTASWGSYTVTWEETGSFPADTFTLDEAADPDFTSGVRQACTLPHGSTVTYTCNVTGRPYGTYYYRVRGHNSQGDGLWSNVQSVVVGDRLPNDPLYSLQWGLAKIKAPGGWGRGDGGGVVVAVVDTGVDLDHPDLAIKWVPGWSYTRDGIPQDDNGHGSHVAGIIAAASNNATGVAGLGWNTQIMAVKVLDQDGSGHFDVVITGVIWAVDHGAQIISLSLGSTSDSSAMHTAIDYAISHGVLVVAAAGNCGDEHYRRSGCSSRNPIIYPAGYAGVLGVGATDQYDLRASFSETGAQVDVTAPGVEVLSTLWDNTYGYGTGTSMATPMVSGLSALVWSRVPALTSDQVANILMNTADDLGAPGRDDEYGYGRINAERAMIAASSPVTQAAARPEPAIAYQSPALDAPIYPGVLLMRFKSPALEAAQQDVLSRYPVQVSGQIAGLGVLRLSVAPGQERAIAAQLAQEASVEFAEPDYMVWLIQ